MRWLENTGHLFKSISVSFFWDGLSRWASSSLFCLDCLVSTSWNPSNFDPTVLGRRRLYLALMWVLRIQNQVFMLVRQGRLSTQPLLQPRLLILILSFHLFLLICRNCACNLHTDLLWFQVSSVGNVTSLLSLAFHILHGFCGWVHFLKVDTFVIWSFFLPPGYKNIAMTFSSKFAMSLFIFKSPVYVAFFCPSVSFLSFLQFLYFPCLVFLSCDQDRTPKILWMPNVLYHRVVFLADGTDHVSPSGVSACLCTDHRKDLVPQCSVLPFLP